MADRCLCHAYFEGVYDKQIKQGQDFDLAQGVRAIDGYGNEVDFTYEPTEIDLCKTGDQEVTYKAFGASFNVIPKLCMPKYKKGVSIPEACPSDLEMITAKRIIRIIRASNPRFLGIPRVTIAQNTAFDPTEGVTAVDDNGNTIDFSYEGKYDLVAEGDDIATFETEYAQNAKSLKVTLEPIQDLHGYDKPWSGGAGTNMIDADNPLTFTATKAISFATPIPSGTMVYAYSSSHTYATEPSSGSKVIAVRFEDANNQVVGITYANSTGIDRVTLTGDAVRVLLYSNGYNYTDSVDVTVTVNDLMLSKSAITSYSPYSNICPIRGHTECVTEVCGVNLFDKTTVVQGAIDDADGQVILPTSNNRCTDFIRVEEGRSYYVKSEQTAGMWGAWYDKDKNYLSGVTRYANSVITAPTNAKYIRLTAIYSAGGNLDTFAINYPSTDHDYHAYNGNTYTTTLGRTVYGGTLDVVSGELVVDRAMVDLGTLNWGGIALGTESARFLTHSIKDKIKFAPSNYRPSPYIISSQYQVYSVSQGLSVDASIAEYATGELYVRDVRYNDATSFTTAMNGVQLCYELATPQTIQLTPQQVELLKGTNNVWSEEGNVRVIYEGNIPQDGSFEYPLEGEYTITYKATDKCGNEGTAERTIVVTPSE